MEFGIENVGEINKKRQAVSLNSHFISLAGETTDVEECVKMNANYRYSTPVILIG